MEASRLKYPGKVPEEETGDGPPPSQPLGATSGPAIAQTLKWAENGAIRAFYRNRRDRERCSSRCHMRSFRAICVRSDTD